MFRCVPIAWYSMTRGTRRMSGFGTTIGPLLDLAFVAVAVSVVALLTPKLGLLLAAVIGLGGTLLVAVVLRQLARYLEGP